VRIFHHNRIKKPHKTIKTAKSGEFSGKMTFPANIFIRPNVLLADKEIGT